MCESMPSCFLCYLFFIYLVYNDIPPSWLCLSISSLMYCVYIQIVDICLCIYVKKPAAGDILFFAACCLHVQFVGQPLVAGYVTENTIPLMNKSCGWKSLDCNKTLVNAILDGPNSSY